MTRYLIFPIACILSSYTFGQEREPMPETKIQATVGQACHILFPDRISYLFPSDTEVTAERAGVQGRMLRVTLGKEATEGCVTVQTEDGTVYPIRVTQTSETSSGVYRITGKEERMHNTPLHDIMERIGNESHPSSRLSEVRQEGVCICVGGVYLHEGYYLVLLRIRNASNTCVTANSARIVSTPKGKLRRTAYTEEEIYPAFEYGVGSSTEPLKEQSMVLAVETGRISEERKYRAVVGFSGSVGEIQVQIGFKSVTKIR